MREEQIEELTRLFAQKLAEQEGDTERKIELANEAIAMLMAETEKGLEDKIRDKYLKTAHDMTGLSDAIKEQEKNLGDAAIFNRKAILKTQEDLRLVISDTREEIEGKLTQVNENLLELNEDHIEAIAKQAKELQALAEALSEKEVQLAQWEARIESLKDGEKGEKGDPGEDGLNQPLLEPVHLVADKDYAKNTLGLYDGGLWIATKEACGDPSLDPIAWSCVLDSMTTMGIQLQDDHTFKLSVRMATGKLIEDSFEIPYHEHKGIWEPGHYKAGQWVTKGSAMWQAMEDTDGEPPGNGWKQILTAPRGKQGPAGKSIEGPQGKPGRNGRDGKDAELDWELLRVFVDGLMSTDPRSEAYPIRAFRGYHSYLETYAAGDVVLYDETLYLATRNVQGERISDDPDAWETLLGLNKFSVPDYMLWKSDWNPSATYGKGAVVKDGDWTMVSVCDNNTDRPAPQPLGDEFPLYDPDNTTNETTTASQILVGSRYTKVTEDPIWVTGFRVYTVAGNLYFCYSVGATGVINELISFEADSTGWVDFDYPSVPLRIGDTFDIVARVQEPATDPVTFTGNWDYNTPNTADIPPSGTVTHANNLPNEFRINKTDNDGGDRSTELEALVVGDIIDIGDVRFSIQSTTDNGTWINFGVSPQLQSGSDGVRSMSFETTPSTTLSYRREVDAWVGDDSVKGLLGIDTAYEDIVPDDNQYSIDLTLQYYDSSDCWEVVSYNGGGSGGGGFSPTIFMGAGTSGYVADPVTEEGKALLDDGNFGFPYAHGAATPDPAGYPEGFLFLVTV